MPDRHEKTGHAEFFLPTVGTAHADPGYAGIVAEHLLRRGLETDLDVRRGHHAFRHRLRRPETILTHDHIHFPADRREIGRLFTGRIAAADHHDVLSPIEKAVARSARRHAHPPEPLFGLQTQVAGFRPGSDNQRFRLDPLLAVDGHPKRTHREIHPGHRTHPDIGPVSDRLLLHILHQDAPVDPVGESRKILNPRRGRKLSARSHPFVKDRRKTRARNINRRRITRRPAADDQAFRFFGLHIVIFNRCVSSCKNQTDYTNIEDIFETARIRTNSFRRDGPGRSRRRGNYDFPKKMPIFIAIKNKSPYETAFIDLIYCRNHFTFRMFVRKIVFRQFEKTAAAKGRNGSRG